MRFSHRPSKLFGRGGGVQGYRRTRERIPTRPKLAELVRLCLPFYGHFLHAFSAVPHAGASFTGALPARGTAQTRGGGIGLNPSDWRESGTPRFSSEGPARCVYPLAFFGIVGKGDGSGRRRTICTVGHGGGIAAAPVRFVRVTCPRPACTHSRIMRGRGFPLPSEHFSSCVRVSLRPAAAPPCCVARGRGALPAPRPRFIGEVFPRLRGHGVLREKAPNFFTPRGLQRDPRARLSVSAYATPARAKLSHKKQGRHAHAQQPRFLCLRVLYHTCCSCNTQAFLLNSLFTL